MTFKDEFVLIKNSMKSTSTNWDRIRLHDPGQTPNEYTLWFDYVHKRHKRKG